MVTRTSLLMTIVGCLLLVPSASATTLTLDQSWGADPSHIAAVHSSDKLRFEQLKGVSLDGNKLIAIASSGIEQLLVANDLDCDRVFVARFTAAGFPDKSFSGDGVFTSAFGAKASCACAVRVDRRHRIVGLMRMVLGKRKRAMAVFRLTSAGKLDKTFGRGGLAVISRATRVEMPVGAFTLASGDKPRIVFKTFRKDDVDTRIMQLRANGSPDRKFGGGGVHLMKGFAPEIAGIDNSSRSYVAGIDDEKRTRILLRRTTSRGKPDSSYGNNGTADAWKVTNTGHKPIAFLMDLSITTDGRAYIAIQQDDSEGSDPGIVSGHVLLSSSGKPDPLLPTGQFDFVDHLSLTGANGRLDFLNVKSEGMILPGDSSAAKLSLIPSGAHGVFETPSNIVDLPIELARLEYLIDGSRKHLYVVGHVAVPEANTGFDSNPYFGRIAAMRFSIG